MAIEMPKGMGNVTERVLPPDGVHEFLVQKAEERYAKDNVTPQMYFELVSQEHPEWAMCFCRVTWPKPDATPTAREFQLLNIARMQHAVGKSQHDPADAKNFLGKKLKFTVKAGEPMSDGSPTVDVNFAPMPKGKDTAGSAPGAGVASSAAKPTTESAVDESAA